MSLFLLQRLAKQTLSKTMDNSNEYEESGLTRQQNFDIFKKDSVLNSPHTSKPKTRNLSLKIY